MTKNELRLMIKEQIKMNSKNKRNRLKQSSSQFETFITLSNYLDNDGMDYTLEYVSDWKGIKDHKFHTLKKNYLTARNELKAYIMKKASEEEELMNIV